MYEVSLQARPLYRLCAQPYSLKQMQRYRRISEQKSWLMDMVFLVLWSLFRCQGFTFDIDSQKWKGVVDKPGK
ncbi:hypothetical protein BJX76DRAFT_337746 [Aspergillus varians]